MPHSRIGRVLKQPFIKFLCHATSYIIFISKLYKKKEKIFINILFNFKFLNLSFDDFGFVKNLVFRFW